MLEIRLRFTREIWDELLSMLDQDPATKVYLNFEQGVMSTTFLFYNDIDEKEWSGYITGLNTIKKTAPTDEGNMFAFKLNDYHLFEIRQVLEDDYEPILKYYPRQLYSAYYSGEKLEIDIKAKNMYNHRK